MRLGLAVVLLAACSAGGPRLIVAAGTTLVDSGLIETLAAEYEAGHPGVEVSVVGDATGQIFVLAANGAADVTITHAPDLEAAFEADGRAAEARTVFSSRFILVGPPELLGVFSGLDVHQAFDLIAANGYPFVSRADGSGTNLTEMSVWDGKDPTSMSWYSQTGQGMGLTLQVASERGAFTLAELGTFLTLQPTLALADAKLSGNDLTNPYKAMAVKGSPVESEAVEFVEWLASQDGRRALAGANEELFGKAVFVPPDS